MSSDVASLVVRIESLEAEKASKRLTALSKKGRAAERSTQRLTSSFSTLIAPLAASVSLFAGFNKLISDTRQLDKLSAGLVTATGSTKAANAQFKILEEFAQNTPFLLEQSVTAFTKLTNFGLDPSERAMRSYGDTSSALGKDLNQMIEAVADAATGEFERLKEFGIKTKRAGDNVSFTFRGTTTTIKNESDKIQEYLIGLGENNFAGSMANRMATLDGAMSNLQDEWDKTFRIISQSNIGDEIESQTRQASFSLKSFNQGLKLVLQDGLFSSDLEEARDRRLKNLLNTIKAQEMFGASLRGSRLEEQLGRELVIIEDQIFAMETRAGIFNIPPDVIPITPTDAGNVKFDSEEQFNIYADWTDKTVKAEEEKNKKIIASNKQKNDAINSMEKSLAGNTISLLTYVGQKNKAAAVAAIALEKAMAIATIYAEAAKGAQAALAWGMITLNPVAGEAAAARIGVMANINAGVVAGLGLLQANSALSGSSGGGGGAGSIPRSNAPILPDTLNLRGANQSQTMNVNLYLTEDGTGQIVAKGLPVALGNDYVGLEKDQNTNIIRAIA